MSRRRLAPGTRLVLAIGVALAAGCSTGTEPVGEEPELVIPPVPVRDTSAPGQTDWLVYDRPQDDHSVSDTIVVTFRNPTGDSLFFRQCAPGTRPWSHDYELEKVPPTTAGDPYYEHGICLGSPGPVHAVASGHGFTDTIPIRLYGGPSDSAEAARVGTGIFRILYDAFWTRKAAGREVLDPPVPDSLRWTNRFLVR